MAIDDKMAASRKAMFYYHEWLTPDQVQQLSASVQREKMEFRNADEEREYAIKYFKSHGVQYAEFLNVLQDNDYDDIAKAAPPKVIAIVLAMESIPPHWASLVLQFHYKLLTSTQVQQLINATDAKWSYEVICHSQDWLTVNLIKQLVGVIATDGYWSYQTLQNCRQLLTADQVQQLIDTIAGEEYLSHRTLENHLENNRELLTDDQVQQLINTIGVGPKWRNPILLSFPEMLPPGRVQQLVNEIATDVELSYYSIPACHKCLTPDQFQQLISTIATDVYWSHDTLEDYRELLTDDQVQQLVNVIATNHKCSLATLRDCGEWLTDTQRQQLLVAEKK